jgi:hypothetical protein
MPFSAVPKSLVVYSNPAALDRLRLDKEHKAMQWTDQFDPRTVFAIDSQLVRRQIVRLENAHEVHPECDGFRKVRVHRV